MFGVFGIIIRLDLLVGVAHAEFLTDFDSSSWEIREPFSGDAFVDTLPDFNFGLGKIRRGTEDDRRDWRQVNLLDLGVDHMETVSFIGVVSVNGCFAPQSSSVCDTVEVDLRTYFALLFDGDEENRLLGDDFSFRNDIEESRELLLVFGGLFSNMDDFRDFSTGDSSKESSDSKYKILRSNCEVDWLSCLFFFLVADDFIEVTFLTGSVSLKLNSLEAMLEKDSVSLELDFLEAMLERGSTSLKLDFPEVVSRVTFCFVSPSSSVRGTVEEDLRTYFALLFDGDEDNRLLDDDFSFRDDIEESRLLLLVFGGLFSDTDDFRNFSTGDLSNESSDSKCEILRPDCEVRWLKSCLLFLLVADDFTGIMFSNGSVLLKLDFRETMLERGSLSLELDFLEAILESGSTSLKLDFPHAMLEGGLVSPKLDFLEAMFELYLVDAALEESSFSKSKIKYDG